MTSDKLTNYVNGVFAPYEEGESINELKTDLLADLQERFQELRAEGKDEAQALRLTIDSIGDIDQTVQEVAQLSRSLERRVLTNCSGADLTEGNSSGVKAHKGKFNASALQSSDFAGADLSGSVFKASDLRKANFNSANLTDCSFSTVDLTGSSFHRSLLVRTVFHSTALENSTFADLKLLDVEVNATDLRKTVFKNCVFNGVVFQKSDLSGQSFAGQTFIGVRFDRSSLKGVSFEGATLKNVSFKPAFALTNKHYRALQAVRFDGARMDKLTYAALKGLGIKPSNVHLI